jgi:hypothetical protein
MKNGHMNKRWLFTGTTVLVTVLLLVMNVSATVTYSHVKKLSMDTVEEKIDKIINSVSYQRLYNLVHPKFTTMYNATCQQEIYNRIITNMTPYLSSYISKGGPLFPGLVEFLQTIGESIMVLFGHGFIGSGCAVIVCSILALFASIVIGVCALPKLSFVITVLSIDFSITFVDDIMLFNIGLIGTMIYCAVLLPLIAVFLLFAIPVADVVLMVVIFLDTLNYV